MDAINYPVLFYPFDKRNRVINNIRPNPCLAVRVEDDVEVYVARTPCTSLILFKVNKDMKMFDTKLQVFEFEHYLCDLKESGDIKSYGFFPDIAMSWRSFDNTGEKKLRVNTKEMGEADMRYKEVHFNLDINADAILKFLQNCYKKEDV